MDPGISNSLGYEPSQSSLKFSGKKDDWPAFRWQFLSTITSFGDMAMEILDMKYDELMAKKTTDLTKIKTEAKGTQDEKDETRVQADKVIAALPEYLMKMKNRIQGYLGQSLSLKAVSLVQSINPGDVHAIWTRLKTEFEGSGSGASIQALYQQAAAIRHDAGSPLSSTISKFDEIYRRMVDKKEVVSNNYRVGQLLFSLPPSYDAIKAAMNASDKEYTWQEAVDKLINQQEQTSIQLPRRQKPSADAYAVTTQVNPCFNCQKPGHAAHNCLNPCTKCDSSGPSHARKDCPYFARFRNASTRGRGGGRPHVGAEGAGAGELLHWQPVLNKPGYMFIRPSYRLTPHHLLSLRLMFWTQDALSISFQDDKNVFQNFKSSRLLSQRHLTVCFNSRRVVMPEFYSKMAVGTGPPHYCRMR